MNADLFLRFGGHILDITTGVVAVSMQQGLRITKCAAIDPHVAIANLRSPNAGVALFCDLLRIGDRRAGQQWVQTRPSMPDMIPVVSAAPRLKGIWFHFGRAHHGFTLGSTIARLLADGLDGRRSFLVLVETGRARAARYFCVPVIACTQTRPFIHASLVWPGDARRHALDVQQKTPPAASFRTGGQVAPC